MITADPDLTKQMDSDGVEDVYPLSPLQQGMLFNSLYAPGSGVDFEQMIITLREEVHAPYLQQAWLATIERHSVLRTAFRWDTGEPVQEVYRRVSPSWQEADWRDLPHPEQ